LDEKISEPRPQRSEPQRLLKTRHRLLGLPLLVEDASQVIVGLGKFRPEAQGLLEAGHGLRQLALLLQDDAQIGIALGVVGPEAQRLLLSLARNRAAM
jgi:hypothetical protein